MTDNELWQAEERLWTGGVAEYRDRLAPGCLMAFPGVGVLAGVEAIAESLEASPRWREVVFSGQTLFETDGLTVLAYEAEARRDEGAPHAALCTSTWMRRGTGWELVQHQQAPIEA